MSGRLVAVERSPVRVLGEACAWEALVGGVGGGKRRAARVLGVSKAEFLFQHNRYFICSSQLLCRFFFNL